MRWEIRRYDVVASTNATARALAQSGAPDGTVVVAEAQTAGRGRAGRHWFSPGGAGCFASLLLFPTVPAVRLATLPLVAGLAVAEAIDRFVPVSAHVKWPNDVWLGGRKVAGILVEAEQLATLRQRVVVGIGVNVNVAAHEFPAELRPVATSVALARGTPVDRELVLHALLASFAERYRTWCAEGFGALRSAFSARHALTGLAVRVRFGDEVHTGRVMGVDAEGALELTGAADDRRTVLAGDVEILP